MKSLSIIKEETDVKGVAEGRHGTDRPESASQ